jgi:glutaredoxin 3
MIAKTIKIYSTPTCPHCKEAKKFFEDKGIAYTTIDVSTDIVARKELIDKGQMAVPVIDIDGEWVIGFDRKKMEQKLGLS